MQPKITLEKLPIRAKNTEDHSFKCGECYKHFDSKKELKDHSFQVHDEHVKCHLCSKKFVTHYFLKKHKLKEHSEDDESESDLLSLRLSDTHATHCDDHMIISYMKLIFMFLKTH